MDAIGGARRCSRVQATRYCWRCKRHVKSGHKFVWIPVNKKGYYRLQHRNCDFPDTYDHDPSVQRMMDSSRNAHFWGRTLTLKQSELLKED